MFMALSFKTIFSRLSCLTVVLFLALAVETEASAQGLRIPTRVFLNGVPAPVAFNDGDSFLVLGGRHSGTKARLSGYNTLESYGDVHQWGGWTKKELYNLAKLATYNARRGVWRCESKDLSRDTYGRILWWCKDLAVDQVRRGLAHAMTVTLDEADPDVLAAQRDAIRHRRGMWAHGVPEYILTSLHSVAEDGRVGGKAYNRLVSTRDGHSAKWRHDDAYPECAHVCANERAVNEAIIEAGVKAVMGDPSLSRLTAKLSEAHLRAVVGDFARLGSIYGVKDRGQDSAILDKLEVLEAQGAFGRKPRRPGSCAVYVEFLRRYGSGRASCLN